MSKNKTKKNTSRAEGVRELGEGVREGVKSAGKALLNYGGLFNPVRNVLHPIQTGKKIKNVIKETGNALGNSFQQLGAIGKILFNHPEWYEKYPLDNIVNLNFGYRNSIQNRLADALGTSDIAADSISTMGVLPIDLTIPKDANNTFTQSVNILYSKIRSANAGAINYSVQDLAAYILNVRSVRAALTQLRRTLGTTYCCSPYDADQPQMLTEASTLRMRFMSGEHPDSIGVKFGTITAHAADIHNFLTIMFNKVRDQLPINLALFDRTDWLFSNVFADSNDAKANFYMFVAPFIPYYEKGDNGVISRINYDMFGESQDSETNYNTMINNISTLISKVCSSNVNIIIAGDILKTFGDAAFYNQKEWALGEACPIIYDEAALTQIQNAYPVQSIYEPTETYNLVTNEHILNYFHEDRGDLVTMNPQNTIVNSYKDKVTPGEAISFTRLQCSTEYSNKSTSIINCGTEIVREVRFITNKDTSLDIYVYSSTVSIGSANTDEIIALANCWSILDWAPMLMYNGAEAKMVVLFDFNNYAIVSRSQLSIFHQYAALSLLATDSHVKRQSEFNFVR